MPLNWHSRLNEKRFYYVVGLAGITAPERLTAQRVGKVFSGLMVLVAMVLLLQWQWYLLREISDFTNFVMSTSIFLFFVIAYIVQLLLVEDRLRFIGQNWSVPLIILGGVPFIIEYKMLAQPLAALRPILAIYILFPSIRTLIGFFMDGHLRTTLLGATVVVIIFGVLVAGIDPGVKTVWDGMWWAVATVSTIGYGDVVPTSALGRVLGVLLVILGLAIFVIITANILALTLKKETRKFRREEREVEKLVDEVRELKELQAKQTKLLERLLKKHKK